jgi:hypothetical protein
MFFIDGTRDSLSHFALLGSVFPVAPLCGRARASKPSGAKMRRKEDEFAPKFSADGSG